MTSSALLALNDALPEGVRRISRTLADAGFRSWAVGGSVRDVLLAVRAGQAPHHRGDWDLATDARPEQVQRLFRKVIPTGIAHGTVTVLLGGDSFELTTLRGERGFSDGRHPDEVFFVDDLKEDLARRDFTVNAIAYSVEDGTLHDPFDGQGDLERGLLRAVGEPGARFAEDGLRVLRAARFCSTLGLRLEEATRAAIRPSLESFRKVSQERVRDEWFKALRSERPSACFRVQQEEGLLAVTAPELWPTEEGAALSTRDEKDPLRSTRHGGSAACAPQDVEVNFEGALDALDRALADPVLRLALLWDCGLQGATSERIARARELATRLRLSNAERERIVSLIAHGELPASLEPPRVRRFLRGLGRANADDQLTFWRASPRVDDAARASVEQAVRRELESGAPLEPKELAVTGKDLLVAGVPAGPELGKILGALFEHVLDVPEDNTKERLLERALAGRNS